MRDALEDWLRETGRSPRPEDVGGLVTSMFEGVRSQVQGEIQRHMATLAAGSARPRSLSSIEDTDGGIPTPILDLGPQATGAASGLSRKITGSTLTENGTMRRKKGLLSLFALLGVAAIACVFLFLRRSPTELPPPAPVASVLPPAPVPTPATTGAVGATQPSPAPPSTATDVPAGLCRGYRLDRHAPPSRRRARPEHTTRAQRHRRDPSSPGSHRSRRAVGDHERLRPASSRSTPTHGRASRRTAA